MTWPLVKEKTSDLSLIWATWLGQLLYYLKVATWMATCSETNKLSFYDSKDLSQKLLGNRDHLLETGELPNAHMDKIII